MLQSERAMISNLGTQQVRSGGMEDKTIQMVSYKTPSRQKKKKKNPSFPNTTTQSLEPS